MRVRSLSTLPAVAAVLVACDGTRADGGFAPSATPELIAAPMSSASRGGGGAAVIRFATVSFILIYDADRQLLSAHMPSDICGPGRLNIVQVQQVVTPSHIGQFIAQVKSDDEQVAVYDASSPEEAGLSAPIDFFGFPDVVDFQKFCDFLGGPKLIAEGTVKRISTFSLASFHARWTGTIQGVDGRAYRLTEVYQLTADPHDPNNAAKFSQRVAHINLKPR
jgi:hypothetical protein